MPSKTQAEARLPAHACAAENAAVVARTGTREDDWNIKGARAQVAQEEHKVKE